MQYARLGRSNLKVSRVCLGTMHFGRVTPEDEAFRIMDRALEMGINFFDTANVYGGNGLTEEVIGRWFAAGRRPARQSRHRHQGVWPHVRQFVAQRRARHLGLQDSQAGR